MDSKDNAVNVNDKDKTVALDNKMSTVEQAFEEWRKSVYTGGATKRDDYIAKNSFIAGDANGFNRALDRVESMIIDYFSPAKQVEKGYKGTITEKDLLSEIQRIKEE